MNAVANIDELRFFLDGREDLVERVRSTGATTTEVMAALTVVETDQTRTDPPATLAQTRVLVVCTILEEDRIELVEDIELVEIA
jgi:hypothetical protein